MLPKITALIIVLLLSTAVLEAQAPDKHNIRIVDTLAPQDKISRNPVILRTELDSMIRQYNAEHPVVQLKETEKPASLNIPGYIPAALVAAIIMLGWLILLSYRQRRRLNRWGDEGRGEEQENIFDTAINKGINDMAKEKLTRGKATPQALEKKISDMSAEMLKLTRENEGLNRVLKEYNGIQHDFDSLRHGMSKTYKVRNYPGYDKTKADGPVLQGVIETEAAVANYAYEKFLKPLLGLADANKNNPAKISEADRAKLLDLLISLSLLYIEYLYLRVNDLSIGGKMVERIQGLREMNGLDTALLKKLNTEHGSRALVLKMILDKTGLFNLSYPVFDETNLNHQ